MDARAANSLTRPIVILSLQTAGSILKELIVVKTYSDLLVLWQYTNEKLGKPSRWGFYDRYFDKSPYPDQEGPV
jgi:hypothetical protein